MKYLNNTWKNRSGCLGIPDKMGLPIFCCESHCPVQRASGREVFWDFCCACLYYCHCMFGRALTVCVQQGHTKRYVRDTWCGPDRCLTDVPGHCTWDVPHFRLRSLHSAGRVGHVSFWFSLRLCGVLKTLRLTFWFCLHRSAPSPEMAFLSVCESLLSVPYRRHFSWSCWGWQRACFVLRQ